MARKKVTLKLIADRSARRSTFKKRRASLMKKAHELATLCGVDACVVVYGEGGGASPPETWPASAAEAARVLNRFKDMPEMDRRKNMLDLEGFLQQRNDKLKTQLEKARRENDRREAALLLSGVIAGRRPVEGLSAGELTGLGLMVNARLKSVDERIQRLHEQGQGDPLTAQHLSSLAALPPPPAPFTGGAGHAWGWLVNVKTEGGGSRSFGGDAAGASTSGGVGDADMPQAQLGNSAFFPGFPWALQDPSFFPPTM